MSASPLKVLIIDDEPPIRKLLRVGLSTQGYEILDATNGKTALALLDENPDLIILDLGLPDIQGLDLLAAIRARNESVPIVVLSSRGDESVKVRALDLGADDYLTKPFGMEELLARMRAALRHQLAIQGERPAFKVGDLTVDLVRRIVKVGEREVKLSPKEYELLARPRAARRQGAHPQVPARRIVERLHRHPVSASLRPPAPSQDRARSGAAAVHHHRDRCGVSAARAGLEWGSVARMSESDMRGRAPAPVSTLLPDIASLIRATGRTCRPPKSPKFEALGNPPHARLSS